MNILDIIILICFVPAIIQGLRKGLVSQVIAIVSILAGVYLSFEFASVASEWLGQYIEGSEQALKILAFALILIAVIAGLTLLGKLLEKIIKVVMLGWLNRLLGAAFSFVKCVLIIGLIFVVINALNETFNLVSKEYIDKSILYPYIKNMTDLVFPYLKELFCWK